MTRRRDMAPAFEAVRIEGGLLNGEYLTKIAHQDAPGQADSDYRIPRGLRLRDELGRYWRIAQALWDDFEAGAGRQDLDALTVTRDALLLPLLRDVLGFTDLESCGRVRIGERSFPLGHAAADGQVPIVIGPHDLGLDTADPRFGEDGRRRSTYGLLQEYLNATDAALWGVVSNGRLLRLVRDNPSLTRPAYIEIDLERLFREGLYPDFQAVWLLLHRSRFESPQAVPSGCLLETWRAGSDEEGVRALGELRGGVEQALRELGTGFVAHRANAVLRERLQSGSLSADVFFQQLLRLVYRLIFLATTEERDTLHLPQAATEARALYRAGYGFANLRERALHGQRTDRHDDLWQGLGITFSALAGGEPALGLPALGGLFAGDQCPDLDGARLENRRLLAAVRGLAYFRRAGTFGRINYRDMDTEELGSVYESLLELVPRVIPGAPWRFGFVGDETEGAGRGHARKLTGSYYTPDGLVQELIKSALVPVIAQCLKDHPADPVEALLSLKVLDPAVGSGHFLLAAGRRIAAEVARLRAASGQPTPAEYRHALRQVVSRCLYGVDLNPMAVELCKTALWLEAQEPGRPLGFLDAHVQCGNSLVGLFDPAALEDGIPDAAYQPLTGDDRSTCTDLKKLNRQAAKRLAIDLRMTGSTLAAVEALPEDDVAQVEAKRRAWEQAVESDEYRRDRLLADLWTAAFFAPKAPETADTVPTSGHLRLAAQDHDLGLPLRERVADLAKRHRFFHWRLAFPQVFDGGGFDVVLGNPPWERIKLQEQEFFADRHPEIAAAPNASARRRKIAALATSDSPADLALHAEFQDALHGAEATSTFVRAGRFPLTGTGDVNLYALFAELFSELPRSSGRAGALVPTGIATDDGTKRFFGHLILSRRLCSLLSFFEIRKWFPSTDDRNPFCLLSVGPCDTPEFVFDAKALADLFDAHKRFALAAADFTLLNPNTRTCPVFRSQQDAELTKKLYRAAPVLILEATGEAPEVNPWSVRFQAMFHMANDSGLFRTHADLEAQGGEPGGNRLVLHGDRWLPLYEAKMVHHYDHRWATYETDGQTSRDMTPAEKADPDSRALPRYWVSEWEVTLRTARAPKVALDACRKQDGAALETALRAWATGHAFNRGDSETARTLLGQAGGADLFGGVALEAALQLERLYPVEPAEYGLLRNGLNRKAGATQDLLRLARPLLEVRRPGYLLGWRDITGVEKIRTVIASVIPLAAVGHTTPLMFPQGSARQRAALLGNLDSLVYDYVARQKVGGTHLTYGYLKQFPTLPPDAYSEADLDIICPRVLELTYTAWDLKPFAEDLGFDGPPFPFDPERRHRLKCELDARYARLYGLTRDELRYILDPLDVLGPDYPSETFRVLKNNELKRFGEYRTQRLVLDAFDRL